MRSGSKILVEDRLTLYLESTKPAYTLYWEGECDFRNPLEVLTQPLNDLLPAVADRKLVLDFRGLTFMNSSSVTPLIAFIKTACSKGIPVHLIYEPRLSWQRITASSMRALMPLFTHLTVEI
jgi:hypothetical protein